MLFITVKLETKLKPTHTLHFIFFFLFPPTRPIKLTNFFFSFLNFNLLPLLFFFHFHFSKLAKAKEKELEAKTENGNNNNCPSHEKIMVEGLRLNSVRISGTFLLSLTMGCNRLTGIPIT